MSDMTGNKMNLSYDEAKRWLELCNAIDRLKSNPDFKLLFDVYTRSEVLRSAYMLVDSYVTMSQSKQQLSDNIIDTMKAAAMFRNYVTVDCERMKEIASKVVFDAEHSPEAE